MCSPSAVVRAVHVYSTALTVGETTCVWRTSAMRNMSLSTLSRRAMTAQSLMKTVRARFLGWLMRAKMMPCARARPQGLPPARGALARPCTALGWCYGSGHSMQCAAQTLRPLCWTSADPAPNFRR